MIKLRRTTIAAAALLLAANLNSCVPVEQQAGTSAAGTEYYASRTLYYEDYVYDKNVHSVQCYVQTNTPEEIFTAPVVPLAQSLPIMLEFDVVNATQKRYVAKLVHCNSDWTRSDLTDMQFLYDFNEYFITDISYSVNTKVPYIHYRFLVPRVKMSGNYLLVVQEEGGNYVLSRRLMVHDNRVKVNAQAGSSIGVGERFTMQQIDFEIFYNQYALVNPSQEVKVLLRQNQRWDNAKGFYRPNFVREDLKKLEFNFYNLENNFQGLNEFRFFDTRSLRTMGMNVATMDLESVPKVVTLGTERSRKNSVYSQDPDINGKVVYDNRDYGDGDTDADYAWVNFSLASPEQAPGSVFIFGGLSDWKLQNEYKMSYNAEKQLYTGRALLKQGFYNYYYVVRPNAKPNTVDAAFFEGSFFNTENTYDVIVYYRPPGTRTDLIIGYSELTINARNNPGRR